MELSLSRPCSSRTGLEFNREVRVRYPSNLIRAAAVGATVVWGAGTAVAAGDPAGARKAPARPLGPSVQTMPPSPVVMFFVGWKLNTLT